MNNDNYCNTLNEKRFFENYSVRTRSRCGCCMSAGRRVTMIGTASRFWRSRGWRWSTRCMRS